MHDIVDQRALCLLEYGPNRVCQCLATVGSNIEHGVGRW